MRTILMMGLLMLSACHAQEPQAPVVPASPIDLSAISVQDARNEVLFERVYRKGLNDHVHIEMHLKNSDMFGRPNRYQMATLEQTDGRYIHFPINRIAQYVIQADLIPAIEQAVQEILAMDKAFIESKPREFTDTKGVRWIREDAQ